VLLLRAVRSALERLRRIELTVHADNAPAIALYRSTGFKQEGEMRDAVLIDRQNKNALLLAIVERSHR
jgi:RimJ/RimL family protein N-acetyltransferase